MKYIILANSNNYSKFEIPRQLTKINGEPLIVRTIRLLKENGVNDIIISAKDKKFDNLGVKRYKPRNCNYDCEKGTGYWLSAFPFELMKEPVCFIWGDVYFSEEAIKTIVKTDTDSTLFFCTYNNQNDLYFKPHDEPLAYKIVDTDLFKKHITRVKRLYDRGKTGRHPIVWEVYRSINGLDVNKHIMTDNYVAINDISCDIDYLEDIKELKLKLGELKMIKVEVIERFTLNDFDKLKNIVRAKTDVKGTLFVGDTFECDEDMVKYLTGDNSQGKVVVRVIEVEPIKDAKFIEKNTEKQKNKKNKK